MKGYIKKLVRILTSHWAKLVYVNLFAVYRFAISGVVVASWYYGEWNWATGVLLSGVLSDYIDGLLARTWHVETKFGFWFDMLSDRCLLMSPFLAEILRGTFPRYVLPILVICIVMTDIMAIGSKGIKAPQVVYWLSLYVAVYLLLLRETSFDDTLLPLVLFALFSLIPACEPAKRAEGEQALREIVSLLPEKYRNQIPNAISVLRIFLALPCYFLVMGDYWIAANVVTTLAWLSDMYDGEAARWLGIVNPKNPLDAIADGVFVVPLVYALNQKGLLPTPLIIIAVVLWITSGILPEYTKGIIKQVFTRVLPLTYLVSATYVSYVLLIQLFSVGYSLFIMAAAVIIAATLKRERLYRLIWQGKRAKYIDLPGNKRNDNE